MNPSSLAPIQPDRKPFPPLHSSGGPIDPKAHVERGTGAAVSLAYLLAGVGVLLGLAVTYGILLLGLIIAPLVDYFNRKKSLALLKGSAIEVNAGQFPEIHQCAEDLARRLGMKTTPAVYLAEGNVINAAAARVAGRQVVVLLDDLVDACLRSGDNQTLTFILGHEMAHHALGHTGMIRSGLARAFKKLARLDEYSCDAIAHQLVGDRNVSARAIALLATGPQLFHFLNFNTLIQQAQQVAADKYSQKAERRLSHPLLLHRLSRFAA